jgi:hypothetical protein
MELIQHKFLRLRNFEISSLQSLESFARSPAGIRPYPPGRLSWDDDFPGTSCQATIAQSLRDKGASCLATISLSQRDKSHSPIQGPRVQLALMSLLAAPLFSSDSWASATFRDRSRKVGTILPNLLAKEFAW